MKRTLQVVVEGTHKILTNPRVLERFLEAAIRENAEKAGIKDDALYVEVHDVHVAGEEIDGKGFLKTREEEIRDILLEEPIDTKPGGGK